MPELLEALSKEERETRVLFPETHTKILELLGQSVELRPLPISVSKKISAKMVPLSTELDRVRKETDAGSPDLDLQTIDTLLDCAMLLINYYKLPFTRERLEEDLTTEQVLDLLSTQVSLNKENNFLLQSLRVVLRMVEWSSLMYQRSPNLPSTPPTASDGESTSSDSPIATPPDSLPSSTTD